MGQTKETSSGSQTGQTTYTPTAEERELQKLQLEQAKSSQAGTISAQTQGLNLVNALLTGQDLPGFLQSLPFGINTEEIGTEGARLAKMYGPGFQNLGISDSGPAFKETARGISNELLVPAKQFNIQNLAQLISLALTGQAQVQAPIQSGTSTLAQSLAGLRSVSQTGTTSARGTTSYDFFTSPFTTALVSGGATGLGQAGGARLFGVRGA